MAESQSDTATTSRDAETDAVVESVVGLAARLGLSVTAEGVEREDQVEWLRSRGCAPAGGCWTWAPATVT